MPGKKKLVYNPSETRRRLLESALEEMYQHGYRMASLANILARAGVTKGALYHHFKNKHELGLAAVRELLRPQIHHTWTNGLEEAEDPLEALGNICHVRLAEMSEETLKYGCALNNLAVEMSPIDEAFRVEIAKVFMEWREIIARALRRGQKRGFVGSHVVPDRTALFIVSTMEGAVCAAKNEQNKEILLACFHEFSLYVQVLRPIPN